MLTMKKLFLSVMLAAIPIIAIAETPERLQCIDWSIATATDSEIQQAKLAVLNTLKDPESATFKNFYVLKASNGNRSICGYVNARNSYGGYAGFTLFHYTPSSDEVLHQENSQLGRLLLPRICQPRIVQ